MDMNIKINSAGLASFFRRAVAVIVLVVCAGCASIAPQPFLHAIAVYNSGSVTIEGLVIDYGPSWHHEYKLVPRSRQPPFREGVGGSWTAMKVGSEMTLRWSTEKGGLVQTVTVPLKPSFLYPVRIWEVRFTDHGLEVWREDDIHYGKPDAHFRPAERVKIFPAGGPEEREKTF